MGKIIYLISVLSELRVVNFILLVLIPMVVGFVIVYLYNDIYFFKGDERKRFEKKLKITTLKFSILWIIIVISTILIPNKKEMYLIALTKDYEIEDISKMSKKEIRSIVDYVFEKMEELKDKKWGFCMINYFDATLKVKTKNERINKIGFIKELVGDLTGREIESVEYLDYEAYEIKFLNKQFKDLIINVHMDSLKAITYDVIRQTKAYLKSVGEDVLLW